MFSRVFITQKVFFSPAAGQQNKASNKLIEKLYPLNILLYPHYFLKTLYPLIIVHPIMKIGTETLLINSVMQRVTMCSWGDGCRN